MSAKRKNKLPTISLCMIVRDAAENLELCLDSVKDAVDEIIIVDTGSQDETISIAKKYTKKIYNFKWCDDFAKARNYSLKFATKDWVLVLDDDEVLTLDSARDIKKILSAEPPEKNAYCLNIYECRREDAEREIRQQKKYSGIYRHLTGRLLRNRRGIKFKNPLHEMITEKKSQALHIISLNVLHYGYHSEPNQERTLRNMRIIKDFLQSNPENVKALYDYARTQSVRGNEDKTLKSMDKTIRMYLQKKEQLPFLPLGYVYKTFINILFDLEAYAAAEKYSYAWLSRLRDKANPDPYMQLGKAVFWQGKVEDAYKILKLVYERYKKSGWQTAGLSEFEKDLFFFYGAACVDQGDYELGEKLLQKAKRKYFKNNSGGVDRLIKIAKQNLRKQNPPKPEDITISLCMIVRDSGKNLQLCLDSVKNVVDEIIIVDTGSTDNTVALAKKYTQKVFHYKWKNNFAQARNFSIKQATKDWILVLDDDEALTVASAKNIRKFLAQAGENVYTLFVYNCTEENARNEIYKNKKFKINTRDYRVCTRLIRNHEGLRWSRPIWEIVLDEDKKDNPTQAVQLLHFEKYRNKNRAARNLPIAKRWLKKPQELAAHCCFLEALAYSPNIGKAELSAQINSSLLCIQDDLEKDSFYNFVTNLLIELKYYQLAEKYCRAWLFIENFYGSLWPRLFLSKTLYLQGKSAEAKAMLNIVTEKSQKDMSFCREAYIPHFQAELAWVKKELSKSK